ncbi:hypothetical protein Y032_0006g3066 [Ancylostoma ceylanicum]|uniref:TIL domain-containing protein n=1 Tax=Ancylostoma ceylanicum TaxID=53326 RepID=A0A016VRF8_9BILA|nr:hypothetical protein Y032_0006g3066 [Ancylostoma ceylanicum]
MVSSYLSVVFLIVLVCPEIIGARMLKKHDLEVPEFLAEGTTEYPGTDETIEPEESKCDENEEYVECSEKCEPRCDTPVYVDCKFSPACTPRCQCKEGYARHSSGKCVPDGECLLVAHTGGHTPRGVYRQPGGELFAQWACPWAELGRATFPGKPLRNRAKSYMYHAKTRMPSENALACSSTVVQLANMETTRYALSNNFLLSQ